MGSKGPFGCECRDGFITVDIESEFAKLIEGWRPLRPTRVHDAGLHFLLNP
ncbi:hypothetical protein GCM10022226_80540 [Sphaerisporangium flaviroseum]|uniref:DUF397 domain-containing protein n=1 Tax=Sphaerisporangium flaviroseum TaxID=509199 RepID=A0ABP7JJM3_9ACTN